MATKTPLAKTPKTAKAAQPYDPSAAAVIEEELNAAVRALELRHAKGR